MLSVVFGCTIKMARIECVTVKISSAITALNLKAVEEALPQSQKYKAARVRTTVGAEVGDAYSPPKW